MKKSFSKFGLVVAALLALAPRSAEAATFLQFFQVTENTPWVINETGGTTTTITGVNIPVTVNINESFCLGACVSGDGLYYLNFTATNPAGPTGIATNTAGVITQKYAGSLSFYSGSGLTGTNLFSVNFSDELSGSATGSSPTLNASDPPDSFTGASSAVFDPAKFGVPQGFALSFSNWSPPFSITGTTVSDATADGSGTFSTTPPVGVVPEPASLLLLGSGLAALAARRRQTRKNKQV